MRLITCYHSLTGRLKHTHTQRTHTMARFTKCLNVTATQLADYDAFSQFLQSGQWISDESTTKGQYIGTDYVGVIYVCWIRKGESLKARNLRMRKMAIAYLNIITDQEDSMRRADARALRYATYRAFVMKCIQFVISIFKSTKDDINTRAHKNNLYASVIDGALFLINRSGSVVYTPWDGLTPDEFLNAYAANTHTQYA